MPAEHDLDPPAMTDNERRAKRRYQAGFAFETMPESRLEHFKKGTTDHVPPEDSADVAERAIRLWESMPPHKR